jgi:hypothetical protein
MINLDDFLYGFFLSVSSVLITIIIFDYVFNIGILVRK